MHLLALLDEEIYVYFDRFLFDFIFILQQFTFCFWMATDDKGNYGTPISYAIPQEDNEITFTDPFGFVLSVKGKPENANPT